MKILTSTTKENLSALLDARKQLDPSAIFDESDQFQTPGIFHLGFEIKDHIIGYAKLKQITSTTIEAITILMHPSLLPQGVLEKFIRAIETFCQTHNFQQFQLVIPARKEKLYRYIGYQYSPLRQPEGKLLMVKTLIHTFESQFAKVYDFVFPLTKPKQTLLKQFLGNHHSLLDVGCANGAVGNRFKDNLSEYVGVDINDRMIDTCLINNLDAHLLDMRDIKSLNKTFDRLICIGNTLVFLKDKNEIKKQIELFADVLNDEGEVLIQLVNYDRIISQNITSLPTLKDESYKCQLERLYTLSKDKSAVQFDLVLHIGRSHYNGSASLVALTSEEIKEMLVRAGFEIKAMFGSFNQEAYDKDVSQSLLVWAKKLKA